MDKDVAQTINLIEEILWLINSNRNINFNEAIKQLRSYNEKSKSIDDNELIGVLPRLLADQTLFPSNADISIFSEQVLGIELQRWKKKSRNELIGIIICAAIENNDLERQINSYILHHIYQNKNEIHSLQSESAKKSTPFQWNEVIRSMARKK